MRIANRNHRPRLAGAWPVMGAALLALLCLADVASAVTLNPRGLGQALIYPYYTVDNNQDTLLSITNASDVGKAVQIRFREALNGRDALSFVLFLGAHDTWTASLTQTDDGARLDSSDTSCTKPPFPQEGVQLRSVGYDGTGGDPADGGEANLSRTREGSIEFIVGGDISQGSPTDLAIKRPAAGGAPHCSDDDFASFESDLDAPTNGVFGSASIVNVGLGTLYGYNADALQSLSKDIMFLPGNPYPGIDLRGASSNEAVHGVARAYVTTNDGHALGVDYAKGIDAVSAVFMADSIYNEYIVSDWIGGRTDWVVTFPTKHFYVDNLYGDVPAAPFDHAFVAPGAADVEVSGASFDREQKVVNFGCTGAECLPTVLPFEVNVVGIGHLNPDFTSPALGSTLSMFEEFFIPAAGDAGNAVLQFSTSENVRTLAGGIEAQHGGSVTLSGLPVTGFMAYNVANANAQPGVLANYTGAVPHRMTVQCEGDNFGCPANPHPGSTPGH